VKTDSDGARGAYTAVRLDFQRPERAMA